MEPRGKPTYAEAVPPSPVHLVAPAPLAVNPNLSNLLAPVDPVDRPGRMVRKDKGTRQSKRALSVRQSAASSGHDFNPADVRNPANRLHAQYNASKGRFSVGVGQPQDSKFPDDLKAFGGNPSAPKIPPAPDKFLNDQFVVDFGGIFPKDIPIYTKASKTSSILLPVMMGFLCGLLLFFLPLFFRISFAISTFVFVRNSSLLLSRWWRQRAKWTKRFYSVFVDDIEHESIERHIKGILLEPLRTHPRNLRSFFASKLDSVIHWFAMATNSSETTVVGRIHTTDTVTPIPTRVDYRNAAMTGTQPAPMQVQLSLAYMQFPHTATSVPLVYVPEIVTTVLNTITRMNEEDSFTQSQVLAARATNLMIESSLQADAINGSAQVAHVIAAGRRIEQAHFREQMQLNSLRAKSSQFMASVTGFLTASPFLLCLGTVLASPTFLLIISHALAYPLRFAWVLVW